MDSLFGEGTSLPVRFFIAFVVVFALIGVTAWLIRRFGTGALGGAGARGRAPRLAVIEAGAVDGRRKLVLIRRDNIEHLIMIGGPTDIVVEANIVRGQTGREPNAQRTPSLQDTMPRAPAEETAWPLQPEVAPRPAPARGGRPGTADEWAAMPPEAALPAPGLAAAPATAAPAAAPNAPAKRSRSADTLAGLAAELSVRPAEPTISMPAMPMPARPAAAPAEAPRAKPAPAPVANTAPDQNLADMASRLEAALRRPGAEPAPGGRPAPRPAPPELTRAAPPIAPQMAPPVAPPAAPLAAPPVLVAAAPILQESVPQTATSAAPAITIEPEKKQGEPVSADDMFGSIEEEMANLLGRPGKP